MTRSFRHTMIALAPSALTAPSTAAGVAGSGCIAIGSVLLLSGCLNESTTLTHAGADPLPDLAPPAPAASAHVPRSVATTTMGRENWPATVISQPRGQVAWSFFGTAEPAWATGGGPGALPDNPPPSFGAGTASPSASATRAASATPRTQAP